MSTYDKTFFIKLKDEWKTSIIDYVSEVKSSNPDFIKKFGQDIANNLRREGNYLIIGCNYVTHSNKTMLELKRVTVYYYDPTSYDLGILKKIDSTIKQEILDSIGKNAFTKTFINNILNIVLEYDTNRLQKEETAQRRPEEHTGCIVYGCSNGIKYAAGRSCDQASIISQEKRTRKPKVLLSVRNGKVYSTAW